jgi:glycosyltransferase involved in cell wall biosynthesis
MHVLMLCALEVWALPEAAGAPSLYRTLRAYGERGHRVTFVTATVGANAYARGGRLREISPGPPPAIRGVSFERFHLPSLQEMPARLPPAVAKVDQKLRFALLFPLLAARRAERVLEREPVDLLYAYEVHGALAARLLRRRQRLPTVARFQGTVLHPALSNALSRVRKYEEVLALRLPADLYIMTDDGTRGDEVLAQLNPAALPNLRFWRNGLDLERLVPARPEERAELRRMLGIPEGAFVLLTASRLAAWKRVDRAIAALPEVTRAVPNALLLIVGDGEERERLERQARAAGVADRARFAGAVPQERVADYMRAADVFLAVADLSNVGNPLLEAMCCGLAAVAVDAGDTRDLVREGDTGRLAPSGEPGVIARAVAGLAREPGTLRRLSEGARRYAEEHFWSWEARLSAELDEVERLVAEPVAGAARRAAG